MPYATFNPKPAKGTRSDRGRISKLLVSVDHYILRAQHEVKDDDKDKVDIEAFVHRQLSFQLSKPTSIPHIFYTKLITLLVKRRKLKEASSVYERMMEDGYVPSPETDMQMLASAIVLSSDRELDEAEAILDAMFASPEYTEELLMKLLETLQLIGLPYPKIVKIVINFLEAKGEEFSPGQRLVNKIVEAQARAGRYQEALETLTQLGDGKPHKGKRKRKGRIDPYVAILAAIYPKSRTMQAQVEDVLAAVNFQGLAPDTATFNTLIECQIKSQSFVPAINVFQAIIKLSQQGAVYPDGKTFRYIFDLIAKVYAKDTRLRKRIKQKLKPLLPPRGVYRTMLEHARSQRLSVDTLLFNSALHMFTSALDYPAAFLVLKAFQLFGLDVDERTYRILLRHVLSRVQKHRHGPAGAAWASRFLEIDLDSLPLDDEITNRLLGWVKTKKFLQARGPYNADPIQPADVAIREDESYIVPSLSIINREELLPLGTRLDSIPLRRLVRRAIYASVDNEDCRPAAGIAFRAISEAKKDILPRRE